MTRWSPRHVLTALTLCALLVVVACSFEVNINTRGGEEASTPVVTPAPDAPAAPSAPSAPRAPEAPPAPPAPVPPAATGVGGAPVVRDALLRYRETREPAPAPDASASACNPSFTPFTEAPSIRNRAEVVEAMQASYPPLLRDAGVGGTLRLYFHILADGVVDAVCLDQSSGHPALDQAGLAVGSTYRFSPARNRGEPVAAWVNMPVTFQIR